MIFPGILSKSLDKFTYKNYLLPSAWQNRIFLFSKKTAVSQLFYTAAHTAVFMYPTPA